MQKGGCWPQYQRGIKVCTEDYPFSPTMYRYLNSGAWMSYAKEATALLETVIEKANKGKEGSKAFNKLNDQVCTYVPMYLSVCI